MKGVCIPKKGGNKPFGHIRKHLEEVYAEKGLYLITDNSVPEIVVTVLNFLDSKDLFIFTNKSVADDEMTEYAKQLALKFNTTAFLQEREKLDTQAKYEFGFSSNAVDVVNKNYILDEFKKQFKEKFSGMEFKQRGHREFVRIVNNKVVQSVLLYKMRESQCFTIEFGCFPMPDGWNIKDKNNLISSRRIGECLEPSQDFWWYCNRNNYPAIVSEAMEVIQEYLMPVFNEIR